MDHLLKTRSAAKTITSFMKFLLAKKNYNLDEESSSAAVKVERSKENRKSKAVT